MSRNSTPPHAYLVQIRQSYASGLVRHAMHHSAYLSMTSAQSSAEREAKATVLDCEKLDWVMNSDCSATAVVDDENHTARFTITRVELRA